jgi:hypothetical protein
MSESDLNCPSEQPRRERGACSRTFNDRVPGPWHAVERQFSQGLLSEVEAIGEIRCVLSESLPTLEEAEPAVLQCLRIVDRLGEGSPQARHAANAFRRWSDHRFARLDDTLNYLEIDVRRLVYMEQYDVHTAWLRSRSRSAPVGLSMANRMSLLDLALEFGVPTAVGDALRWRSGIRGGIAAPGLVEPGLTEWAVRALFILLVRSGTGATALGELLTALRDPLLAPIVARLATNTMLTGDAAREQVAGGVEALRQVLVESRERWTAREAGAAEAAADWLTDRLAATTSQAVP